ncbi:hypothetical protein [Streptomyces sp. NBC_00233]|uniref:hypothetical protein n=1 Tax=Streptomyces sp. NBC_00233 TaxID=2975686 RepID=UPI00225AF6E7|nr:hypothetical protein [Streptomyces sp. NBC_00233]MCX5228292.1 hypothetical protein [Streptomyces sp. NBC_00233]
MSFGTYARRVRDEQAAPARRYRALRCAVAEYGPLGFHATWAYLAATAVPAPDLRRDTAALLRALDILEASRRARIEEIAVFAARRRVEKAAGVRTPRGTDHLASPWRPRWPGGAGPSRLGLVAAVANRRAAFLQVPRPDPSLRSDDLRGRLMDLHGRLDACAAAYLTALGRVDDRDGPAGILAGIHRHLTPGYAPLNVPLLQWLRFAELLDYAVKATAVPHSRSLHSGAWVRSTSFSDSGRGHGLTR